MTKGDGLRKFALFLSVCTVLWLPTFAGAQELDLAVGGSKLYSTKNTNASLAYLPPPESYGTFAGVSLLRTFENHFGYSAELTTSYKRQLYNGFQEYRPFLYDLNAVFAPHVAKRMTADFMGGAGGQTVVFYNQYNGCGFPGGCTPRVNSTHFLLHAGAGLRYTVWRGIFVRPEANFYRVFNNNDFHSGNVLRLGASIGYTFPRD
jgi:hypothetical protein